MSVCSSLLAWLISCNFSKLFPLCRQENPQCCFQGTQVIFRLLFLWLLLFLMFQYHYSQKKIVFSICSNLFFVVWLFCRTARAAVDFSTEESRHVVFAVWQAGLDTNTGRTGHRGMNWESAFIVLLVLFPFFFTCCFFIYFLCWSSFIPPLSFCHVVCR